MKFVKYMILLLVVSISSTSYASDWKNDWTINGMSLSKFGHMTNRDMVQFTLGIITSIATHTLGHVIYLEAKNHDWNFEGISEYCESYMSDNDGQWHGRSGPVLQLFMGTVLSKSKYKKTLFVTGYNSATFIELSTYKLLNKDESDFDTITEYGGNGNLEYAFYTLYSLRLLEINKR